MAQSRKETNQILENVFNAFLGVEQLPDEQISAFVDEIQNFVIQATYGGSLHHCCGANLTVSPNIAGEKLFREVFKDVSIKYMVNKMMVDKAVATRDYSRAVSSAVAFFNDNVNLAYQIERKRRSQMAEDWAKKFPEPKHNNRPGIVPEIKERDLVRFK